jgi:hypothetical protein
VVNAGFDPSVSPNWQMVPVGGMRLLVVTGSAGLIPRIRSANPRTTPLTVTTSGLPGIVLLTLSGISAGRAWVEWVPSASFAGPVTNDSQLEISVKAQKPIRTAFHYVSDGRRQVTNRRIADLDAMITGANAILTPQANVKLMRKSAAALPIAKNLGRVVQFSSHIPGVPAWQHEWDDVTAGADATADFNVFFVHEYEQTRTPLIDETRAGTIAAEKNCLLEDDIASAPETLAHETLHLLGIDHSPTTSHLIASGAIRTGQFISRDQANAINQSGI